MKYDETAPNWLSDIVEAARNKHPFFEFRTVNEIAAAIENAPQGQSIKGRSDVKDAIRDGLHAADERLRDIELYPATKTTSPSHQAASVIAKRLDITSP